VPFWLTTVSGVTPRAPRHEEQAGFVRLCNDLRPSRSGNQLALMSRMLRPSRLPADTKVMSKVTVWTLGFVALALSGCASTTRVAQFGPLAEGQSLVTLVVSEDLDVVRRECANVPATGPILGCHIAFPAKAISLRPVRSVKIVRYVESAPSAVTFEIDAHELCHAVAALQLIEDPCHIGNNGELQAGMNGIAGMAGIRSR
jgi:hypothetical protein